MIRSVVIFFFWLVLPAAVVAQNACELTLTKAQEEFDAGRFHGVPALLKECLEKGQNREWEQRAYLLLSETYLLLEDPAKADESFLRVLQANPEFVTDESRDPIDLVYLSKKFTATPIFSVTGRVGFNASIIRVIHDVTMAEQAPGSEPVEEKYSLNLGWQAGVGAEYHYWPGISLAGEVMYQFTSFAYNARNVNSYRLDFTDRQTWVSVPVIVKYTHGGKPLRPFAMLGMSANLLLRDRSDIVIDGDRESEVFNYAYKRMHFSPSVVAGLGLKYKWGLRYIFGEVRYSFGMKDLADPKTRNDKFGGVNNEWPYADDAYRMDNAYVSIGYVHPFYKARKLKKARTKSVLRKTRKPDVESD